MAKARLAEMAAHLRASLIGVLRTFAAPLDGGPLLGGPSELFCQWADDMYHPDAPAFAVAFGPAERAALAAFDAAFRRVSALCPAMMPPVEVYVASAAGTELAGSARAALRALGGAADTEPGAAAGGGGM